MNKVLVVAPHPDDETLGCGGTLLRHRQAGDELHWLMATNLDTAHGYSENQVQKRNVEIEKVTACYGFASVTNLGHRPAALDQVPLLTLVGQVSDLFRSIEPEILYLPFRGDAHTDHAITFDACAACAKSFRYPYVVSVRVYETLSETDFGMRPDGAAFRPNLFVDITSQIDGKIEAIKLYESEIEPPPFPRSEATIRSLAAVRGAVAGTLAAEAFMILREIQK